MGATKNDCVSAESGSRKYWTRTSGNSPCLYIKLDRGQEHAFRSPKDFDHPIQVTEECLRGLVQVGLIKIPTKSALKHACPITSVCSKESVKWCENLVHTVMPIWRDNEELIIWRATKLTRFGVKVQELAPAPRVLQEHPAQGRRRGHRPSDLHAAHFHAQVAGVEDHTDALGLQRLHQAIGHLLHQPFLILEPAREVVDDPRDLRQADDPSGWDVAHCRRPDER